MLRPLKRGQRLSADNISPGAPHRPLAPRYPPILSVPASERTCERSSTLLASREAVEEFHRALIIAKYFLFFAETRRMGFTAAPRELHRMLQVQHCVIQHVRHHVVRTGFAIQLAV